MGVTMLEHLSSLTSISPNIYCSGPRNPRASSTWSVWKKKMYLKLSRGHERTVIFYKNHWVVTYLVSLFSSRQFLKFPTIIFILIPSDFNSLHTNNFIRIIADKFLVKKIKTAQKQVEFNWGQLFVLTWCECLTLVMMLNMRGSFPSSSWDSSWP